jgi:hypothetical protein
MKPQMARADGRRELERRESHEDDGGKNVQSRDERMLSEWLVVCGQFSGSQVNAQPAYHRLRLLFSSEGVHDPEQHQTPEDRRSDAYRGE